MPAIKVGDIDLYYEVHGQGFPLVLIAGIGYHSSLKTTAGQVYLPGVFVCR